MMPQRLARTGLERRGSSLGQLVLRRSVCLMGMLILVAGCHARQQSNDATLLQKISRAGNLNAAPPKPGELAERGRAEITEECAKQSYGTASKGLIVSETGLHEDVFTLRDRVSYGAIGYGLDEALRLETLLRAESRVQEHSADQSDCIQEFADHLKSVSDPLVAGDERLKELDASAYRDSARSAQEQAEKQLRETQSVDEPKAQQPNSPPHRY
jgi:hypothetical protein